MLINRNVMVFKDPLTRDAYLTALDNDKEGPSQELDGVIIHVTGSLEGSPTMLLVLCDDGTLHDVPITRVVVDA